MAVTSVHRVSLSDAEERYPSLDWLGRVTALPFHLGDCQALSVLCFQHAWSRLGFWDISSSADSCIHFSCPSLFQRTAHLHHQSPCLPNWPQHEEELGSRKQAGCNCFLLLWQHEKQLSDYQCGWSQGRRLMVPGVFTVRRGSWLSALAEGRLRWPTLNT